MNKELSKLWASFKKDKDELIPCITQDRTTGEVLMLAYMDEESFILTNNTGFAHYHSRSRGKLWKKGETSGNVQEVIEIRVDCDMDTILLSVDQTGPACHTGNRSCFYRSIGDILKEQEQQDPKQYKTRGALK